MGPDLGSKLLLVVALVYSLSFLLYLAYVIFPKRLRQGGIAFGVLLVGVLLHIVVIVQRAVVAQHAPFQTLYEALSWFAFWVVVCFLFIEWRRKIRFPGLIITALAVGACLYALLGLSPGIRPLPPALQSFWFVWHVACGFASYALFANAFALEISYLSLKDGWRHNLEGSDIHSLHRLAYKLVLFGFPLHTFCLASGAFWAQAAWGTYWGWDPKETWTLITWMVYVLYLHARVTPRWTGRRSSYLNILGFACVIITFVGVNWLTKLLRIPSIHTF
jgi:cytochrome c-type biogenesis protein CcsB